MDVVEVVAWFAETIVDVAYVGVDGRDRYQIGTAPGVDLPVVLGAIRAFPIVGRTAAGFVVRVPAGIPARVTLAGQGGARPLVDAELVLSRDARIELELGGLVVRITRLQRGAAAVPRARPALAPWGYVAGVLAAHLAVWAVAMGVTPPPPVATPGPTRPRHVHVHVVHEPPAPPPRAPEPPPEPTLTQPPAPPPPSAGGRARRMARPGKEVARSTDPRTRAIEDARHAGILGAVELLDFKDMLPSVDIGDALEGTGALYDEDAANGRLFGGGGNGRRFDPLAHCTDCGVIPTGPYQTASVTARPPAVLAVCGAGCTVEGDLDRAALRAALGQRAAELGGCYQRSAEAGARAEVIVVFEIDEAGAVRGVRATGAGDLTGCVAAEVSTLAFPARARPTHVSAPMVFRPS